MTHATVLLRTIKKKCLECCGGNRVFVENCTASPQAHPYPQCKLWIYRMGAVEPRKGVNVTPAKLLYAIRQHCLECAGTSNEVEKCTSSPTADAYHTCELWKYRFGKDPEPKAKREITEEQREELRERGRRVAQVRKEQLAATKAEAEKSALDEWV